MSNQDLGKVATKTSDLWRLADKAYWISKAYYQYYKDMRLNTGFTGDLVIVTMGKVGSLTLVHSLNATSHIHKLRVRKAHCLSKEGEEYYERIFESGYANWSAFPEKTKMLIARRQVQARRVRKELGKGRKQKFVTIVRDPVATNLSGFFHNYKWWPKELRERCRSDVQSCLDELKLRFLGHYPHEIPLTWFDMDLAATLDIDFFADEFPKSRGYNIYTSPVAEILILRLENLNACAGAAFSDFLGLDDFQLVRMNEAKEKWYHKAYKDFKEWVILPDSYLDEMYSSKWYQHFYSADELDKFREQWSSIT